MYESDQPIGFEIPKNTMFAPLLSLPTLSTVNGPNDFELMTRIAAGDQKAFALFYERHAAQIYALCLRVLQDRADADEVFTTCMFEVWERADRFDADRGSPVTFLMTVARSRAIDQLRRKRSNQRLTAERASQPETHPKSPLTACMDEENSKAVRAAVGQLDVGQREAIDCAYYEGLSHTQTAEKLGRSLGTVKTQIRQGLIRLRELLRKI
jgi:RNA polymerase sigma-70 factor (ECF subfamily)